MTLLGETGEYSRTKERLLARLDKVAAVPGEQEEIYIGDAGGASPEWSSQLQRPASAPGAVERSNDNRSPGYRLSKS